MEGEHQSTTVIQFNDAGNAIDSATFRLFADNFVGINLTFRNTYNLPLPSNDAKKVSVAPAAVVNGDKVMFYSCGFISVQDTLCDGIGRHYFFSCDIEGAVDFIWGRGQSVYMRCRINVAGRLMGGTPGFITAQGRESEQDTSGFVFIMCGRAYRRYSRVLFSRTIMSDIVVPQGWDAWNYAGQEQTITYAEVNCEGPGANKKGRVKWEKTLPPDEINFLKSPKTFIDADNWMEQLPVSAKLPMY
ncbi:PREDICTED: probable pectinesterase 29 [Tarenaya hassleriana]|uniref:probable pectinesterase 29 n=1 Tax=Tarenaya hassleriana TaxID=28532 RepID=UPI00053C581A|nr:PREDICTED: probable pectinesterase 29 [Tarenaya hassleriana]